MGDRAEELVIRQAQAMGADLFEVGLFKPAPPGAVHFSEMLLRTWDLETLVQSIPWLKVQNVDGRNIFIRPKGEHALTLLDDLTSQTLERMSHSGFTPALIVETSPDNFQAWLNHGRVLPKETSTAVARALAERFDADPGSADWRHFGRLASFANRKNEHREPGGHYPIVHLVHSTGEIYEQAECFVSSIEEELNKQRQEADRRRQWFREHRQSSKAVGPLKTIEDFRNDPRYRSDGNRIDLAYALYAISHGVPEDEIRAAIGSRDLNKKGKANRQADYIERTLKKAIDAARDLARSR